MEQINGVEYFDSEFPGGDRASAHFAIRTVPLRADSPLSVRSNSMNAIVYSSDPWAGILEHLEQATSLNHEASTWIASRLAEFLCRNTEPDDDWSASDVANAPPERSDCLPRPGFRVVERDERDVVISWQDSTRGRLADQRWRRCTAYASGVCAMSGGQIRRGDYIYRPLRRLSNFANLGDTILASIIDGAYEDTPASPAKQPAARTPRGQTRR